MKEYLEEGKTIRDAMINSNRYTRFVQHRFDRCRMLGMNVSSPMRFYEATEIYRGREIETPYFEKNYIKGIATDKIPALRLRNRDYALQLAKLLGEAAAYNLIVGRYDNFNGRVLFDDGDEIITEDKCLPKSLTVSFSTRAFMDFKEVGIGWEKKKFPKEFAELTPEYAAPVNNRKSMLPDVNEFAEAYINSFVRRFKQIRAEYWRRKDKESFDKLFCSNNYLDFTYEWSKALERLDNSNADELEEIVRKNILF